MRDYLIERLFSLSDQRLHILMMIEGGERAGWSVKVCKGPCENEKRKLMKTSESIAELSDLEPCLTSLSSMQSGGSHCLHWPHSLLSSATLPVLLVWF